MNIESANAWIMIIVAVTGGLTTIAASITGFLTLRNSRQLGEVHTVVNSNLTKKEAEIELLRNMLVGAKMQAQVSEEARKMLAAEAKELAHVRQPVTVKVMTPEEPLPVTVVPPLPPPP